ncbi:hypothetical protein PLESTB_000489700 [Pleodorina starrii]|uniref:General transcription and DNA repair factor IIH subunit TFB4 n=1 Tax=Pleodorina starrii TaxID=330485 RepID=A0A9W6BGD5_9CHLO|nr:hypothetical protein PLESTM_000361000 [Pleodorina starrii]GLC51320.1 hypothetical protein PLESTB_000489700 [Pleodorina starrii]GLC63683.1 hypothetical protein PLESTF_000063000 [Pleodorina starrii]
MADADGDLLVLLLDLALLRPDNPAAASMGVPPTEILAQLLAFTNAYTMLNSRNRLAIFAGQHDMCHLVHLGLGEEANSSTASVFPAGCLHTRLSELVARCSAAAAAAPSHAAAPSSFALSGGLSRALCLIHRLQHHRPGGGGGGGRRGRPRLLALVASPDASMQYIPVMNAIFSAQRAEVVLDAVVLAPEDSSFLQQAAHLTGGLYFRPAATTGLLGLLLNYFVTDSSTRGQLDVSQELGVDFRASCFCHKYVIETGFVCSVCLSIFCQPSRACSTCGTAFTTGAGAGAAGAGAGAAARGGG